MAPTDDRERWSEELVGWADPKEEDVMALEVTIGQALAFLEASVELKRAPRARRDGGLMTGPQRSEMTEFRVLELLERVDRFCVIRAEILFRGCDLVATKELRRDLSGVLDATLTEWQDAGLSTAPEYFDLLDTKERVDERLEGA